MTRMQFEEPPSVSLWAAALHRGRWGGAIPRIEASADRVPTDCARYAEVCGFPSADPLPPTWPGVATAGLQAAVMTAPAFPLPVVGLVHTRQRLTRHRHLRAGEALSATCVVEGHRVVRSGGEFDLVLTVRAGDAVVWEGTSTLLSRAIPGSGGERKEPPAGATWAATRTATWELPASLGRAYAAVSGDYNPIHLSPWTSRLFGYPRPIAHGWWVLARALAELGDAVPEVCVVDARFVGTLPLPGRVTFACGAEGDSVRFEVNAAGPGVVGTVRGR